MASRQKNQNRRNAQILSVVIGLMVIFTFVFSLVATNTGDDNNNPTPQPNTEPTSAPASTKVVLPTPDANPQFGGLSPYVHSSGYFQAFRPAGSDWEAPNENQSGPNTNAPGVIFQSIPRQVVIHNYVVPGVEYASLESFSQNYLTETYFKGAWLGQLDDQGNATGYERFTETNRQITENSVISDFDLVSKGANYVGRDISRLEGTWLYSTRIVVPANDPGLLDVLQNLVVPGFFGYPDLQKLPQFWQTFSDSRWGYAIKYPGEWTRVSGGPGERIRFNVDIPDLEMTILVQSVEDFTVDSDETASQWATANLSAVSILGTARIQHEMGEGYAVAYTFRAASNDIQSGLVALLNGPDSRLIVADMQLNLSDVNLLDAESFAGLQDEVQRTLLTDARRALLDGFIILPEATRTLPAFVPVVTPEATAEVNADSTVESAATVEATAEATAVATEPAE
ncbi:MAG TPA: hypothetical protein VHP83_27145 [Aggregatilineaceae bacterium]|nr:hypothetical protein [Aggregatilineaceae bacterium]